MFSTIARGCSLTEVKNGNSSTGHFQDRHTCFSSTVPGMSLAFVSLIPGDESGASLLTKVALKGAVQREQQAGRGRVSQLKTLCALELGRTDSGQGHRLILECPGQTQATQQLSVLPSTPMSDRTIWSFSDTILTGG